MCGGRSHLLFPVTQAVLVGAGQGSSTELIWKSERKEMDSGQSPPQRNQVVGGEGWERRKFSSRKGPAVPNGLLWRLQLQPRALQSIRIRWRVGAPQVTKGAVASPECHGYDVSKRRAWHRFKSQPPKSEEAGPRDTPFLPVSCKLRNFKNPKTQNPITPPSMNLNFQ